ncbi:unnamed protein product [Blepharisma stoltei]|uniref:C-CAP/cofactor C-like domain-containing protein n=1 Tax=Blepharisma stoltei TaxID=1481888 RepID=A0AAU9KK50_9CILI|nr:unnamed protein product [Blepharisma stoltei]
MSSIDNFTFKGETGKTLIKSPGSIQGQVFNLMQLEGCTIYLLDHSDAVYVDECRNCTIFIGPVQGSCFLRNCNTSTFSIACNQIRTRDCTELTIFLYSQADPHIEKSFGIKFAPYNFSYPLQDKHFQAAKLNPNANKWSVVYDHNSSEGEGHFEYLPPNQFVEESKDLSGLPPPVNPVQRSVMYGGNIREDIIPPRAAKNIQNPIPVRRDLPPPAITNPTDNQNLSAQEDRRYVPFNSPKMGEVSQVEAKIQNQVQLNANISQNEDLGIIQVLTYNYRQGQGFEYDYTGVTSFPNEIIRGTLESLDVIVKPFNESLNLLFLCSMLVVIGFFVLFLQFFILRMTSEWRKEAWAIVIVFICISFIVLQVIIFLKKRNISKDGEIKVLEFVTQENSKFYEQKKATLNATLNMVRIEIK